MTTLLALNGAASLAQQPVALTAERAVDYRRPQELRFSPDGSRLVFALNGFWTDSWAPRLFVLDVKSGETRALLTPAGSERAPEWSVDGRHIRFLARRDGPTQVYEVEAGGGQPQALTESLTGVDSFHSSVTGQIAYLAREDRCKADDRAPQLADQECDLERLWVLDPLSGRKRQLTSGRWRVSEFVWRDAEHLIVKATERPFAEDFGGAVYQISIADGHQTLLSQPALPFAGLAAAPDGRQLALTSARAAGPDPHDLYLQELPVGAPRNVSASLDRYVAEIHWQDAHNLWVQASNGFFNELYLFRAGHRPSQAALPLSVSTFAVAPDGRIAFVGTDFQRLPEIYLRGNNGAVRQLTHLQEGWEGIRLSAPEYFRTPSFDGLSIEAALFRPPGHAREQLPLVLLVHGGPSSNFSAAYFWFNSWVQLLVEHGFQVLLVNPRGSLGYGEEFLKANRADWGGGDYRDLMTVLDAVIARGQTDPSRLGIGGWSYGAEMSAWAIGHTDRFRAAVAGGVVYDQAAEFGTENHSAGDEWYFGTPWEHPDVFARNSPMTFIRNARTPTLLLHGEADHNNPIGQSQALYRALKALGVEAQFVTYPGEPHIPRQRANQIDALKRMLEWYDRHLAAP
jgi:dipeptidyl aminopeptidase/acylaminoacyl peptidase